MTRKTDNSEQPSDSTETGPAPDGRPDRQEEFPWLAFYRKYTDGPIEKLRPIMERFPRITRFLILTLWGLITIALLWSLQKFSAGIESRSIQTGLLFGGLAALLMHRTLRRSIAAVFLVAVVFYSLLFFIGNWTDIRHGNLSIDVAVNEIANGVLGNPITADIAATYTVQINEAARIPNRLITVSQAHEQTGEHHGASAQFYRYLAEVRVDDDRIRELAIRETDVCEPLDRACEIFHLLNFVATRIKYVNDPELPFDHIQSPLLTMDLEAGDCEDQTILLMTLLRSIRIHTMIVFTPGHAYPMACVEEELPRRSRYLDQNHLVYEFSNTDTPYCYPLEPTDTDTRIGERYPHSDEFIYAVDPITSDYYEFHDE